MRWNLKLLFAALSLYLGAVMLVIRALSAGSSFLAAVAVLLMLLAVGCFVLAVWLPRRRVDWDRVEAEQRLWESGPLGRSWLRARQRLNKMWKL